MTFNPFLILLFFGFFLHISTENSKCNIENLRDLLKSNASEASFVQICKCAPEFTKEMYLDEVKAMIDYCNDTLILNETTNSILLLKEKLKEIESLLKNKTQQKVYEVSPAFRWAQSLKYIFIESKL